MTLQPDEIELILTYIQTLRAKILHAQALDTAKEFSALNFKLTMEEKLARLETIYRDEIIGRYAR